MTEQEIKQEIEYMVPPGGELTVWRRRADGAFVYPVYGGQDGAPIGTGTTLLRSGRGYSIIWEPSDTLKIVRDKLRLAIEALAA